MLFPRALGRTRLRIVLTMSAVGVLFLASVPVVANSMQIVPEPDRSGDIASGENRWDFNGSERCLMRKINGARRSHGLRALGSDKQIGYVARRHSAAMAGSRAVWHDGALGQKLTRWRRLGQNTGRGGKCRYIFRSFMRSSMHRANILGRWKHVGVGATWAGGRLYVQQVFESRLDPGNVYSYP